MLLGHSFPTDWTFTLVDGSATDLLSSGDAGNTAYLIDHWPAQRTFWTWPTGTQTTSVTAILTASRSAAVTPRCAALLGCPLPVGCKAVIEAKRPGDSNWDDQDLGGNSATATVKALPNGSNGIIWIFDSGLDDVTSVRVTIYNDVGGATSLTADELLSIGQFVFGDGIETDSLVGNGESWLPIGTARTIAQQPYLSGADSLRTWEVEPALLTAAQARGDSLDGSDWQTVCGLIARDPFVMLVNYTDTEANIAASSIYGTAEGLGLSGVTARHGQPARLRITEAPAG